MLKRCAGAALTPITQVSAALAFACAKLEELEQAAQKDMPTEPEWRVKHNFSVNGELVNLDTELFGILKAATATILMMAHVNDWFNDIGDVVLPEELSRPSKVEVQAIHEVLSYASAWNSWERAQLRIRLNHRPIEYLPQPFPANVPAAIETIVDAPPNHDVELVDFIANDRLFTRTNQHYFEMLQFESRPPTYPSLEQETKIPPAGFISFEEKHGLYSLSECYSFDVTKDPNRYAGLRIVEWLRGYAILRRLAGELSPKADSEHPCPQLAEDELMQYLRHGDLGVDQARTFIRHCCLSRGRSDIYDRPLIRIGTDRYAFVSPSQRNAILGPIVLSGIAGVGAKVERKVKDFEKRLRGAIEGPNRKVTSFTKMRGGQEYDYDALLHWGDFCFIFECKNRTLSNGVLQLAYFAQQESGSHASQVRRLVAGLLRYPDMLDDHLPEARGKLLVPCVVNNLQYSIPDGVYGVFFADYSILTRFFDSPVIGEVGSRPGAEKKRSKDGEIMRIWAGDEPTPLDLLRHLRCSFQFILTRDHTDHRRILSALSAREAVCGGEYVKVDMNVESGRAAAAAYADLIPLWSEKEWARRLPRIP